MTYRLFFCLLPLLGLALLGPGKAQAQPRTLTLMECVRLAVEHDPEAQNARARVPIGRLKRSEAVQKFLPKLDTQIVRSPQLDFFGRPVTDRNLWTASVGLEQPLYAGGTLWKGVQQADAETRRSEWEYRHRELVVSAEAIKAYYQALTAQETIHQYAALLKAGEEDLREGQARLAAGLVTRADVLELEVKLLETQQKLSKSRADFQVALSALKKATGLPDEVQPLLNRQYPLQDIKGEQDELLGEAQSRRPLLAYQQEDVRYQQFRLDVEKGKQLPQFSLVARHEWENPDNIFKGKKDWIVLLKGSISWGGSTLTYSDQRVELYPNIYAFPSFQEPRTYAFSVRTLKYTLFDRTSNRVQEAEARADLSLSRNRWQESQRQTYHDVKDACAQREDSLSRRATALRQIALAEELLKVQRTKYGLGLTTLVEVFKARAGLAEAQVNFTMAQNDHAIALGKLHQAVGRELTFQGAGR